MKTSTYLLILLAIGLAFTSYKWAISTTDRNSTDMNTTIQNIMTRTSVRSYTERPIDKETLDTLLQAAMAAPSAGNKQPWRFVVIDDKALLDSISANFPTMSMARKAPLAIVMCGDTTATFPGDGRDYWIQDVSAASENLLLAAHALGLGAVWCGIYPQMARVDRISDMLALPSEIIPMACLCIGYPSGESHPKDKWKPEYIHYNSWATTSPEK